MVGLKPFEPILAIPLDQPFIRQCEDVDELYAVRIGIFSEVVQHRICLGIYCPSFRITNGISEVHVRM